MRGAQRPIANIWAVASRIKGYYGKRDLQTGGREARWTRRGGSRVGAGVGRRMQPAKSKIKFSEVCTPGGLRPRKTDFCFSDSGQGACWGDAHHRGWEREGGRLPPVDTLLMEAFPVF